MVVPYFHQSLMAFVTTKYERNGVVHRNLVFSSGISVLCALDSRNPSPWRVVAYPEVTPTLD
jgi:hypothetical protein